MSEDRLRAVESALGSHLSECALQNQMMWRELRGLKAVVWAAFIGSFSVLLIITGLLLKNHLHL